MEVLAEAQAAILIQVDKSHKLRMVEQKPGRNLGSLELSGFHTNSVVQIQNF